MTTGGAETDAWHRQPKTARIPEALSAREDLPRMLQSERHQAISLSSRRDANVSDACRQQGVRRPNNGKWRLGCCCVEKEEKDVGFNRLLGWKCSELMEGKASTSSCRGLRQSA